MSADQASVVGVQFDGSYSRMNTAGGPIGSFNNTSISGGFSYHAGSAPTPAPAPRCPPASSNFVGRKEEQKMLWTFFFGPCVRPEERRIYSVVGIGGCGKTQLCRKFTKRVENRFSERDQAHLVFYLDGTTQATLEAGFVAIARANGLVESSEAALAWISALDQEFFMYIDNTDDPTINLRPYFSNSDRARVLITTRLPEKAEHYGTGHGSKLELRSLSQDEAVSLFQKIVHMSEERRLREKDLVITLVKELHFHPLAVVQAGACISKARWTVRRYLDRFHDLRTSLMDGDKDHVEDTAIDDYRSRVYTTWKISYDILPTRAQALLRVCSHLHHSGITEDIFQDAYRGIPHFDSPSIPFSSTEQSVFSDTSGFLHQFAVDNSWDADAFRWCMQEACSTSLLTFDEASQYSIHPLVHDCLRSLEQSTGPSTTAFLLASAIFSLTSRGDELGLVRLLPHTQQLLSAWSREQYIGIHPQILTNFGHIFFTAGRYRDAEQLERTALSRLQHENGADDIDTIRTMNNLANTYHALGQSNKAESMQREVLERMMRKLGPEHLDTIVAMNNLATTLHALGRYREAEVLQSEVLKQSERQLEPEHPRTITAMNNLANTFQGLRMYNEAQSMQRKVVEQRRRTLGTNHPDTLSATLNLTNTLQALGKYHEAEPVQWELQEQMERHLGPDHPNTLKAMHTLAITLNALGRRDEAESIQREELEKARRVYGVSHPQIAWSLTRLAVTLYQCAQYGEAEPLLCQALQIMREAVGAEHIHTLTMQANLNKTREKLEEVSAIQGCDSGAKTTISDSPGRTT